MKWTKDLWFAGFLEFSGHNVARYEKNGFKVTFYFEVNEDDWKRLKLEYHQSDFSKYRAEIEKLKGLAY